MAQTAREATDTEQQGPPKGYANWKEYWNTNPTRRQIHQEVRQQILPHYHRQHVEPLDTWLGMPASERAFERAKVWPARELVWPPRTPWWWKRLTRWVRELFAGDEEQDDG